LCDAARASSSRGAVADAGEIERVCADLAAAGFIEPTIRHEVAEAGTDPSWGSPKSAGKAPCGDSGT